MRLATPKPGTTSPEGLSTTGESIRFAKGVQKIGSFQRDPHLRMNLSIAEGAISESGIRDLVSQDPWRGIPWAILPAPSKEHSRVDSRTTSSGSTETC